MDLFYNSKLAKLNMNQINFLAKPFIQSISFTKYNYKRNPPINEKSIFKRKSVYFKIAKTTIAEINKNISPVDNETNFESCSKMPRNHSKR